MHGLRGSVRRSNQSETNIQNQIRAALGGDPDVLLWRNARGVAEHFDERTNAVRKQQFGLAPGACDLIGMVRVNITPSVTIARFIAIEIKRPKQKPTDEQKRFINLVNRFLGAAIVADSVQSALEFVAAVKTNSYVPTYYDL